MTIIPFGYRIEDEKAVPDEVDAAKLRTLFNEYLDCGSMLAAARKAGVEKTHSMIGRMLRNEAYLGTEFYPRLIDDETFQKAQEIRLQTATKLGRVRPAKVRTVKAVNLNFTVGTIEKRFQDPYLQAQYAYEQIQEKIL